MSKSVAVTFIIILSIVAIALTGGFIFLLRGNFDFSNWDLSFSGYSDNLIEKKSFESVEEINVDISSLDLFVEESTDETVTVELYSSKDVEHKFEIEEGKLTLFAKNNFNFGFLTKSPKLVVKVPRDYTNKFAVDSKVGDIHVGSLENLKPTIKSTVGDVKITRVDEATVEVGTGDVKVDDIKTLTVKQGTGDTKVQSVETITVDAHTGDVKIQDVKNKMSITNTTGDIKVQSATINEDSNISNKTGDIKVSSLTGAYIEATNNVGDIKINNNDRKLELTCTIHTNTGDIRVN